MTNQVHPKDRKYTFRGVKEEVKLDYFTINRDNLETNSNDSCKESSTGVFDECAYQKVCFFPGGDALMISKQFFLLISTFAIVGHWRFMVR